MKASHLSAFFLGILAWAAFQAQIPETPAWVNNGCAGVVCTMPAEVFDGLRAGQAWYEAGTPDLCPDQSAIKGGCLSADPDFRAWIELARSDSSKLVLVADSTLYGAGSPLYTGVPGDGVWPAWAYGGVFAYGLPSAQVPTVPPVDSVAWAAWWDAMCSASTTGCSTGSVVHSHSFALAMPDGSTFNGTTGPPQ